VKAVSLLDVNVLIAMAWPAHRDHQKVHEWLASSARRMRSPCYKPTSPSTPILVR
jgi:hypothetical protein